MLTGAIYGDQESSSTMPVLNKSCFMHRQAKTDDTIFYTYISLIIEGILIMTSNSEMKQTTKPKSISNFNAQFLNASLYTLWAPASSIPVRMP